jgi:hypothetical protein
MKRPFGVMAGVSMMQLPRLKTADMSINNRTGYFAGGFFEPFKVSRWGFRSELLFSRQGYDYANRQQTGAVRLSYLLLHQFASVRVAPFLDLYGGGQIAILLDGGVDSSASPSSVPATPGNLNDYFNRLNYGFAAGFGIHLPKGFSVGGRYNIFFDLLKSRPGSGYPDYVPDYSSNLKNGMWQFYAGYRF